MSHQSWQEGTPPRRKQRFTDSVHLLLRATVGLGLAWHGAQKLFGSGGSDFSGMEGFTSVVARLGFPFPGFFAWSAALAEFVGGLCLAAGLGTRVAALFLAFTMAVAVYRSARQASLNELAWLYMISAVYFLPAGGGYYSLDRFLFGPRDS